MGRLSRSIKRSIKSINRKLVGLASRSPRLICHIISHLWSKLRAIRARVNAKKPSIKFSAKLFVSLVVLLIMLRSLPYLAPIRASDIAQDQTALEFVDRHGLPLGTILTRNQEHTAVVPLDRVAPNFINAIIAAEDKRFYEHGAIDLRAIARATLTAIEAKRIISGASTITMQLARLISDHPDRHLTNKLKEIWLSWRLVAGMSKSEILQAYINRLPMGGNVYGVEAAARLYFDLPASELNLAQASILAALPNDPVRLDPYAHDHFLEDDPEAKELGQAKISDRLKQRQRYVLNRMVADGYINAELADRAAREQVAFQALDQQGIIAAPHFLFWLSDRLGANPPTPIRTTIDRSLQQFIAAQIQQIIAALAHKNVSHAAAVAIDNHTGEVLAYAGSTDYFAQRTTGAQRWRAGAAATWLDTEAFCLSIGAGKTADFTKHNFGGCTCLLCDPWC
jgi:penicillin-binding protein 1C